LWKTKIFLGVGGGEKEGGGGGGGGGGEGGCLAPPPPPPPPPPSRQGLWVWRSLALTSGGFDPYWRINLDKGAGVALVPKRVEK